MLLQNGFCPVVTIFAVNFPFLFPDMSFNYFEWVTEGLLIFIIGVIGFFGNGLSVWTFWRQRVHRIFHNLLLSLAIFDMVRNKNQYSILQITIHQFGSHLLILKFLLICTRKCDFEGPIQSNTLNFFQVCNLNF